MNNIIEFPNKEKEQVELIESVIDSISEQIQVLEIQKEEIREQRKILEKIIHRNKFKIVFSNDD